MNAPLLEIRNLVKHFPVTRDMFGRPLSRVHALDDVSFDIRRGEVVALVGESGCGKSTVGRLALRLLDPTAGKIIFDGRDISRLSRRDLRPIRRRMQLVFQDPYASLNPRMTIGQTLEEPLALHSIGLRNGRRGRVDELLRLVGLSPEHARHYPNEFSGGQRQRVGIARALASEPELLICDEAVSALDVSVQAQILNLLKELQARFGLALLFISHDLAVVRHIADTVAVMYLGKIVEIGPKARIFAQPRHPYTHALLAAVPIMQPELPRRRPAIAGDVPSPILPPDGCRFHPRCSFALDRCRTVVPLPSQAAPDHVVACHRWRELPPASLTFATRSPETDRLRRLQARFQSASDTPTTGERHYV